VKENEVADDRNLDVTERHVELLHSIEEDEEVLREAVQELAVATERKLDITRFIRAAPLEWTVGAFCVGFWLGLSRREPKIEIPVSTAGYRRLR
jgi:hypothetical protein